MKTICLGDLVRIIGGGTPDRSVSEYWGKGIPWVTVKDFKEIEISSALESITELGLQSSASNLIEAGSILVPTRMALGKAAINTVDVAINQDLKAIQILDSSLLDQRYLLRFLLSKSSYFESRGKGATVKGITLDVLRELPVPLPPLEEQQRIAAILDKADSLRRKRAQAIALADDFLRATFLDMFGDPVTNPKGWAENCKLSDVAEIVSGITKGRVTKGEELFDVPYLAVSNVQDRFIKLDVVKRIEATKDEIERYKLLKDDLLLTEGGDPDKLGRGALWDGSIENCIHQNHVFRVRVNSELILPVFLNWLVGSQRGKSYFLSAAKQTTGIASINMRQLKAFPLILPPVSLQAAFSEMVEKTAQLLVKMKRQSLAELQSALSLV